MASESDIKCAIHSSSNAVQWCSNCIQGLCVDCLVFHNQAKPLKNHKTIPITDFVQLPSFVKTRNWNCKEHNYALEFFCPLHENLGCFYCIQGGHKQCNGVENIHKMAENIKNSSCLEDLETSMQDILTNLDTILADRVRNISNIDKQKKSSLNKIAEIKTYLVNRLNKLENEIISDLSNTVKKEKSWLDKLVHILKTRKIKITQLSDDIAKIKQYASDVDVFLAILDVGKEIQHAESFIESLQDDSCLKSKEILLVPESKTILEKNIQTLAKILVTSKPSKIKFKETKKVRAQSFIAGIPNIKLKANGKSLIPPEPGMKPEITSEPDMQPQIREKTDMEPDINGRPDVKTKMHPKLRTESRCQEVEFTTKSDTQSERSKKPGMQPNISGKHGMQPKISAKSTNKSRCQKLDANDHNKMWQQQCLEAFDKINISSPNLVFESFMKIPSDRIEITSCKILSKDQFIFLDYENKCVVFSSSGGSDIKRIPVTSNPIDFTYMGENVIAVTLYSENAVCFLDILQGKAIQRLNIMGKCFGIDYADKKLLLTLPHMNCIQFIDYADKAIPQYHNLRTSKSAFYLRYFESKIFCSNHIENSIFCLSVLGLNLWEFKDERLIEPFNLTVNTDGDIFVACRKHKTIILVSSDGSKCQRLIHHIPAITLPRAIDYSEQYCRFLVCDGRSGLSIVFKVNQ